jgi:hypothetical protein
MASAILEMWIGNHPRMIRDDATVVVLAVQ